jgi:tetratricopeptide (TPR) repeat protein
MFATFRKLFTSPPAPPAAGVDWKKQGNELLAEGRVPEAEACYRRATQARPGDAAAHLNLGHALMEQQQFQGARLSLGESVRLDPANHEGHFLLARAQRATGDAQAALKSYERVLGLQADFTLAAQERNMLLTQLGQKAIDGDRPGEARGWFQQWATFAPSDPAAHAHVGLACEWLEDMKAAEQAYRTALRLAPGHPQALFGLGNVLLLQGHALTAADHYARVLAQVPDHVLALTHLARALLESERYKEAEARFDQLLALRPDDADALLGRANSILGQHRHADALQAYDEVIAVAPQAALAHLNRGNAQLDLGGLEPALESFREALRVRPGYVEALVNIGSVLQRLNRYLEACTAYEQAIALDPGMAAAHWNLGLSRLVTGELEAGWAEAEWRWQALRREPLRTGQPQWTGEPLQGKTLLVYSEQGLGDTLQFCRYVPQLVAQGARVLLRVQAPLQRLLRTLPASCMLLTESDPLPAHGYQCALLSLPLGFRTSLQTIPQAVPYLSSQPQLVERWRALLGPGEGLRVGLAWSGNPTHVNDRNRSLPLDDLPLSMPGVRFISLQKDVRDADRAALQRSGIAQYGELLTDFEQTAALVECLDLVITVDTSVAHLAGALGKAAWVLLPFAPDWRWLLERTDSPWYPSARLFRQPALGDWGSVHAAVREALAARVAGSA